MNWKPTHAGLERKVKELEFTSPEGTLTKRNQYYNTLFEGASDSIFIMEEYRFIECNKMTLQMFGCENKEDVLGFYPWKFSPPHQPDGRLSQEKAIEVMDIALEGKVQRFYWKHTRKDGTPFDSEVSLNLLEAGDKKLLQAIVRDITDRKQSEKEIRNKNEELAATNRKLVEAQKEFEKSEAMLQSIFRAAPTGIGIITDRKLGWTNKMITQMTGYSKEELDGKSARILYPSDEDFEYVGREKYAQIKEKGTGSVETRWKRKGGQIIDVLLSSTPINPDDLKAGVTFTALDITERKQSEEEKLKLQAQLQQAKKMEAIGTLAGGIAHQFNNALAGITGNIDILKINYPNDENLDTCIKPMKDSARRMTQLTKQLLAYARGGKYQAKAIYLSDFVRDTLPLLKHTINPLIEINTDLPHDILSIVADLTQMQMVLSAILSNASEAIEGRGRIRIICRNETIMDETAENFQELKPGNYVSLAIEDDGKGMDKKTKMQIFEPFFTTKFHGRGLGMAAAYGIIHNHDGSINIASEPGKGTRVCIYLPAVGEVISEPKEPSAEISSGEGNILVIEDEDIVMDVIRSILEKLGYRVLEAKTGKEAIDIAEKYDGDIELALLDMKLPDIEGGKIYPIIKKVRPNLKVIVCSGYAIDGPAQEILDSGAHDFMQKPFSIAALSEKLCKILGKGPDERM